MSKIYLLLTVVVVLGLGGVYLMGGGNDALTAITALKAPSSLTAVAISPAQINLSWVDTNTSEGGYEIYRSLKSGGGFVLMSTTSADTTSYLDQQGLSLSTTYYYRARAIRGGSHSTYSGVANATTLATYVPTPTPTPISTPAPEDTTPPTLSIISPTSNSSFYANQTITVSASTTDNVGISRVVFSGGSSLIPDQTDDSYPYSIQVPITSSSAIGQHCVFVFSYDTSNNQTTAGPRCFYVVAKPTPTPSPTASASCITDSDRSINYGVAGYTTFSAGKYYDQYGGGWITTSGGTLYDTCVDPNVIGAGVNLKEVYCNGNSVSDPLWPGNAFLEVGYASCAYGCNAGACNSNPSPLPLTVNVFSWPNPVTTGQLAHWTASSSGGNGTYTYSWSGSNSLRGTSSAVTMTYATSGIKSGYVYVTSGNQTTFASSTLLVKDPTPLPTSTPPIVGITATRDVSSPPNQYVVAGTTGFTAAVYKLTNPNNTGLVINNITLAVSGTSSASSMNNLALYDGDTRISDIQSINSLTGDTTFYLLNINLLASSSKLISLKLNVPTDAGLGTTIALKITGINDSAGSTWNLIGAVSRIMTVLDHGFVMASRSADDAESQAGAILANGENVLAKFRFTSYYEDMTINKIHILVSNTSSTYNGASYFVADDVPVLKLYDGAIQIGAISGYNVNASGASTSIAEVSGLSWVIPKDSSRALTVKGVIPAIGQYGTGADFGTSVWTILNRTGFEAQGLSAKDTNLIYSGSLVGNEKIVYKSVPKLTSVAAGSFKLTAGTIPVLKFKIKADGPEQISWKQIQFKVNVTQASVSAVEAVPGSSVGNVGLKDTTGGGSTQLNIASAFSAYNSYSASQISLGGLGTQTGYISLLLNSEQVVPAGTEKEYELSLNIRNLSSVVGASSITLNVYKQETWKSIGTVNNVRASNGILNDASPSFVWSDNSVVGHSDGQVSSSTPDWANGYLLMGLPSNTITLSN